MKGQMRLSNKLGQVIQLKNGEVVGKITVERVYMVNRKTTGFVVNQRTGSALKVKLIANECWNVA